MTIDSLMIQPERYKSLLHEKVFREGIEVYSMMAHQKMPFVKKEELFGFTFSNIYTETRGTLIEEAIDREDYKLFGMTKEDFLTKTYSGQLEDIAVNPYIKQSEFDDATKLFLEFYQLMVVDRDGDAENCPLQEVW